MSRFFQNILTQMQDLRRKLWIESFFLFSAVIFLGFIFYQMDIFLAAHLHPEMKSFRWLYFIYHGFNKSSFMHIASLAASTIATTAALVFSITIVALLSIASNFSVRYVMHTFDDSKMRLIISLFITTYFYAFLFPLLYNYESINPLGQLAFLLFLVVLCFLSLVVYMQHIMQSIQVDTICDYNFQQIIKKFKSTLSPVEEIGDQLSNKKKSIRGKESKISSGSSGYILNINYQKLYDVACEKGIHINVICSEGEFILDSTYVLSITSREPLEEDIKQQLQGYIDISRIEETSDTIQKYIKHLIDIALKSLSPGVNDTVSAEIVLDYISAIIREVYKMGDPKDSFYDTKGHKVLTISAFSIDQIIEETIDSIRFYSLDNQPALCYLVKLFGNTVIFARKDRQKQLINEQVAAIEEAIRTNRFLPHDSQVLQSAVDKYHQKFAARFKD